ncbi:hypothetical protein [Actinacidiphila acidipaludis]|uniref:Uncharacterized protein n=1 Tax=Actinacidiphila acidipaludis TaxID=2873382 RepID=A0ABS7QG02_9ACTN|nr:hypothetical protein [Streptomyces acidipaludis]MBY8881370.1 hypothetical protein [Streptomyces acidipaludis]
MTIEHPEGAGDPDFRFNISSMASAKAAMDRLGMIEHGLVPPMPDREDFGLTYHEACVLEGEQLPPAVIAFRAAVQSAFDWQTDDPAGIPEHKLGHTNDGWLVTPAEIHAALAVLEGQPASAKVGTFAEKYSESWAEWCDYLTRAAAHGGFRVE